MIFSRRRVDASLVCLTFKTRIISAKGSRWSSRIGTPFPLSRTTLHETTVRRRLSTGADRMGMRRHSMLAGALMFRSYIRPHLLLGILMTAAALVFAICAIRLSGIAADDSFIHRRIAANYQLLGRPYFNPDQRVMVTSSPLWTLLLAAADAILPVANPVPWLESGFVLMGATAAYLLAREGPREGLPGLIFPAASFLYVFIGDLPSSLSQMETPCAIALILTGSLGVMKGKSWGMPLLLLACFARYESVLLFALAGIWLAVRRGWTRWCLLSCTGVALSGLAWLLWEYGTVIPNTVIAKSHLYLLTYRQTVRGFASIPQALLWAALGALWWSYGRNRRSQQNPVAILLVAFGVLLGVGYVARKTYIFFWYPPLVMVPLAIGILLWTDSKRFRPAAIGAVFAGALLLPTGTPDVGLLVAALQGTLGNIPDFPLVARVHEYRQIGAALYSQCPTGILMTSEIGGLGWAFPGEIRDGAGLASPEAIRYHPMRVPGERSSGTLGEIPAGFVRDRHPDLIVSYDLLAESALPAARSLGYRDYEYPLFVRGDRASATSLWDARKMHVLVAPDGRCSPAAVDKAVRSALEQ